MTLHPQAEAYLQFLKREQVPPLSALSPEDARVWDEKVTSLLSKKSENVGRTQDIKIESGDRQIPIRIYTPTTLDGRSMILYFHGGGWVLGNLDQVDYPCRLLANRTRSVVISVGYRLSPEYKFPGPVEDCYAATEWAASNAKRLGADEERLVVCGDSAGGNLAAVVSLMAKDRGHPSISNQILIYPIVDLSDRNYENFPDDQSPGLTKGDMNWFIKHYIPREEELENPYASPIRRKDLSALPPAMLITAEYDILTTQGNAYADQLRRSKVKVNSAHYPGQIHGFFTLPDSFDAAHEAIKRIAEELSPNQ